MLIPCVCYAGVTFGMELVKSLYHRLQENLIYVISRGDVKDSNKSRSNLESNLELSFSHLTSIDEVAFAPGFFPTKLYPFTSIHDITLLTT